MASRNIAISITIDNRDALNAAKATNEALKSVGIEAKNAAEAEVAASKLAIAASKLQTQEQVNNLKLIAATAVSTRASASSASKAAAQQQITDLKLVAAAAMAESQKEVAASRASIAAIREKTAETRASATATKLAGDATYKQSQLQEGLTNSFIKGNLAARGISIAYLMIKDSLQYAAEEAIQFEVNLTKLATLTDAGAGSMKYLEGTIRTLAVSTNMSQNEIAKTALEMGKMGLSSLQVGEALGSVVKLSRALDEDLVRTGETVVTVLNAYGFGAEEANRVTNQLAFTVKASALDIETFATAFSYVGGAAKLAGVSFEELQGSMDVLSNAGIKSSTIGTQLRRIIIELSDANSKASKIAGGTIESFGGLSNALIALKEKHLDVNQVLQTFGRQATSVAATAIKYSHTIKEMGEQTKQTGDITDKMSGDMNTTLLASLQGIKTAWADLGIEISKSTGFLSTFAQMAKNALSSVSEGIKQSKDVARFQKEDPKEYQKAHDEYVRANMPMYANASAEQVANVNVPKGAIAESQGFQTAKLFQFPKEDRQSLLRENAVESLQSTLPKSVNLPKGFDVDSAKNIPLDLIGPTKATQAKYDEIVDAFGKDKEGQAKFAEALLLAQKKAAMNSDNSALAKFDDPDGILNKEKKGKNKKEFKPNKASQFFLNMQAEDAPLSFANQEQDDKDNNIGAVKEQSIVKNAPEFNKKFEDMKVSLEKDTVKAEGKGNSKEDRLKLLKDEQNAKLKLYESHGMDVAALKKAQEQESHDYSVKLAQDEFAMKMAAGQQFASGMGALFSALAGQNKAMHDIAKGFAMADIAMNTAVGVMKAYAQTGVFGVVSSIGVAAAGAAQLAVVSRQASGTDQVVNRPTMFMAGESGSERVTVTPRAKMNSGGGGGGNITVNIHGDVMDGAKFTEAVDVAQSRLKRNRV